MAAPMGTAILPQRRVTMWFHLSTKPTPVYVKVPEDEIVQYAVILALDAYEQHDVSPGDMTVKFNGEAVRPGAPISQYENTSDDNPLLLELPELQVYRQRIEDSSAAWSDFVEEGASNTRFGPSLKRPKLEEFQQPSLGVISASTFAKQSIGKRNKIVHGNAPLYTHWFAIDLYNQYLRSTKKLQAGSSDSVSVTLRESEHTISMDSLTFVTEHFRTISLMPEAEIFDGRGIMSDPYLKCDEVAQSACYAVTLDRFLFPSDKVDTGRCLHQCPVIHRGNEKADMCVVQWLNGPATPVLVSDIKLNDLQVATNKTAAYALRAMEVRSQSERNRKTLTICLGLPISNGECKLLVYVGDDGFAHEIVIATSPQLSPAFFSVLFGAVHSLLTVPINMSTPGMKPMKSIELKPLVYTNIDRVFCSPDKKTVYKMYDSEVFDGIPNLDLMNMIRENYLPNSSLITLTDDNRVQCLKYDYIEGSHTPTCHTQFRTIFNDLCLLHGTGVVHGDIRELNLLFSSNGKDAWMIDFDLAGVPGSNYPLMYNHHGIYERHPDARAGLPRRKAHDLHGLQAIIQKCLARFSELDELLKEVEELI